MGFFDKLKGEFVDIIEWTDDSNNTMVYRFDRYGNEIKFGAKLTVRESQMAVFVNEGQIADVFAPGMHTLETKNVPILSTLQGWKHGFSSPFKAEVYFVNTRNFTDQKWGTKNPITLDDARFGMFEIRAFGTFATRVVDPKLFLKEIVGTDGEFTTDEISNQLRSMIVARFTESAGESGITAEKFAGNTSELSELCQGILDKEFAAYGLKITKFVIENVSMPDEIKKEIYELSRLDRIDLQKLGQIKTAKAIEKAAENPGGMASAGVGLGAGFAVAQQMAQGFSPTSQHQAPPSVPPPLPVVSFFVADNGQQKGPFQEAQLMQMLQSGQLTRETLVWKQGMANWSPAGEQAELSKIFASAPPPLPKM